MPANTSEPIAHDEPGTRKERVAWYAYDWGNQPFVTTVMTVLGTVYLTRLAGTAAGCDPDEDACGDTRVSLLWLDVPIESLWAYTVSASVFATVIAMPIVGAMADRAESKRRLLGLFAFGGAAMIFAFVFFGADGGDYQAAVGLILGANILYSCSMVVYNSFLPQLARSEDRDRMSSLGWAFGYLAGGSFLAFNLVCLEIAKAVDVDQLTVVQYSIASTGLWWTGWTMFTLARLRDRPPAAAVDSGSGVWSGGFRQLGRTLKELRGYPYTLLFLAAFLLYSDGISAVIALAATYGDQELGLDAGTLVLTILIVQFVNFVGALSLKALATVVGAKRTVLLGLIGWTGVVLAAWWLPENNAGAFLGLGVALGIVMGGTQALSRSLFSQLIPKGREAAYFGIYQIADRGTSWIAPLMFGVVVSVTGSMRTGIIGLLVFFVVGFALLAMVPIRRAIVAAGNTPPHKV
ncbi:MAG: MFS transporter [Stackebrandtia sp.]